MNIIQHCIGMKVDWPEVAPLPKLDWAWEIANLPLGPRTKAFDEATHRRCTECREVLPLENFSHAKDRHGKVRPRSECKPCRVERNRRNREKKRLALKGGKV